MQAINILNSHLTGCNTDVLIPRTAEIAYINFDNQDDGYVSF